MESEPPVAAATTALESAEQGAKVDTKGPPPPLRFQVCSVRDKYVYECLT